MNQLVEFFRKLFSDDGFMPRWICGRWTDFNGWLYISGDILTGSAYLAIPTIILRFIHGRKISYFRTLYYLFPAFIILCGSTHLINMLMFWFPVYRLGALLAMLTGIVSWITVAHLYKSVPFAISLTPRDKLEEEIVLRQQAEAKLIDKQHELEQKNQQLEQFASIASHDLMEPLRKMSIFIDRLQRTNAGNLNQEGQEYVRKVQSACTRMSTLINSVLDYSKIAQIDIAEVDLNILLKEVVADLELKITETQARVDVLSGMPTLMADSSQLHQVFTNLLSNAIKFTPTGVQPQVMISHDMVKGSHLSSAAQEYLKIHERNLLAVDYVQIFIQDNGIGFNEAYKERVFELFQRLHGKNSSYTGSGIGLSIVKRICDLHHGWVRAESKEGEGSTFIIILPVQMHSQNG